MLKKLFAVLVVVCVGATVSARDDKDEKAIQGTWSVTALTKDGKAAAPDELKEVKVIIGDGKVTLKFGDVEVGKATLKMDTAKKHFDMTPEDGDNKGKLQPGIYKLDGDTLELCLPQPGTERPKDFKSTEGSKLTHVKLKRAK